MMNTTTKGLILFAFIAIVSATQYLSEYNAIIRGTISSTSSDCEGRMVVGGNTHLKNYAVGSRLTQDCNRLDLQVGGNLEAISGQVSRGKATVGGTIHTESWGTPCGAIQSVPLSFDINSVFADFITQSTQSGNEATNGVVSTSYEDLYMSGTETINYFNVDGSILQTISGIHIDIPADTWAIVNFHGDNLEFFDMNFFLSSTSNRQNVLYNFPEATKIFAARVSFQGSILAPSASLYYDNGNIEGSVAVANYLGSGEFHNYPYNPPESTCHCFSCNRTITVPAYDLFSLFIYSDISSAATDFEGRVAAGGNVNFSFVGVSSKAPISNGTRDDLIVKGNLYYHDGEVFGGNIVVEGTVDVERVGTPHGQLTNGAVPIPFDTDFAELLLVSESLSSWAVNGQTIVSYSTLDFFGSDILLNVFHIDVATLQAARTIVFSIPVSSHAIININGDAVAFENAGIVLNGALPERVLWNFYNAKTLTMSSIQIEGSLLAPRTAVTFNNGNLNGAIYAHSYTGNGEIHLAEWEPLPIPCPPCEC